MDALVHTQLIVSIHRSNLQFKKITEFSLFFAMAMKKRLTKFTEKSLKIDKALKKA
jgi:hypothetical protein